MQELRKETTITAKQGKNHSTCSTILGLSILAQYTEKIIVLIEQGYELSLF